MGGEEAKEEEKANFAPGNRLSLNVTVERVPVGGEIDAEGEEVFDFGPGNPSLEERASDRRAEMGVEDFDQSGIDGEEGSEEGDEARAPKIRRAPRGPTQLEREQHEATHLPYRDWCAHCVRGSGESTPHKRKNLESEEEQQNKIPRMVLNYHFMSTRDAENGDNPVLAMKDESTGNRYLRAVGQKGVEGMEWLVKDLHEELKSWGRIGGTVGNILIKTDGEASIVALRNALARYHGGAVTPEVPPTGESQAHGSAEDNGRRMRSLIQIFKLAHWKSEPL